MIASTLPYSTDTLSKALVDFRRAHGLDAKYAGMSDEAKLLFERHDIVHVLFGLDTSTRDEAKADGWTLLGTDVSWAELRQFTKLPEEKEILEELGWWTIVKTVVRAIPDYAGLAWRARRLTKRWRWSDNARYRDMPVAQIRQEFGIDSALA